MHFFGKLIEILSIKAQTPQMFGWVHILSLALAILLGIVFCIVFKKPTEKTAKRLILITTLVVIALEIYKQVVFSFSYNGQTVSFDFQWYAFPFQFCSMPMYVGLLAALIKKGWLHDALCAFLATYGFFAGIVVMIYPAQVYMDIVGINIQTMICHGLMLSMGIYLLASGYVELKHKTMLKALAIFSSIVVFVMIMNEVVYYSGILNGEVLNMFFISRHFAPSLPVYSLVQAVVPYPFCVLLYIAGFSAASYVILITAMIIDKIVSAIKNKQTVKV